jgi:alkylhydroperoxidase family enzyme
VSDVVALRPVLSRRPDLLGRIETLFARVEDGRIDTELLALCRLRVRTLLACPDETGPTRLPEVVDERQRACLDFTERFVIDHRAITDSDVEAVRAYMSDAEVVAFTTALALYDGFCRFEFLHPGD